MPKFRSRSDGTHYPLIGSRTMKGARRSRRYTAEEGGEEMFGKVSHHKEKGKVVVTAVSSGKINGHYGDILDERIEYENVAEMREWLPERIKEDRDIDKVVLQF